jgi:fibronectin-binding autotransporter adhesin
MKTRVVLLAASLLAGSAAAQTDYIWDGNGGNQNTGLSANWFAPAPTNGATGNFIFDTDNMPGPTYNSNANWNQSGQTATSFFFDGNPSIAGFDIGGGPQTINLSGDLTVEDGVHFFAPQLALQQNINFDIQSGTFTKDGSIISGPYSLTKTGAGTLCLEVSLVTDGYSGGLNINGGTVQVGSDNFIGATNGTGIAFDGGTLKFTGADPSASVRDYSFGAGGGTIEVSDPAGEWRLATTSAIGGAGGLTKTGAGLLTLQSQAGFTGVTTINEGTLSVKVADGTQNFSGSSIVLGETGNANDAVLELGTGTGITTGGQTLTVKPGGARTITTWAGLDNTTYWDTTLDADIALEGDVHLKVWQAGGYRTLEIKGDITGTGDVYADADTRGGTAGTLRMSGVNDFSGSLHIGQDSKVSTLWADGGALDEDNDVYLYNGSSLRVTGQDQIGAINSTDPTTFVEMRNANILTIGVSGHDGDFAGFVEDGPGTLALKKLGDGIQTIDGDCAYSGSTIIGGGALIFNGDNSAATNWVRVDVDGTLGGTGVVGGVCTLKGALAPGAGVGTLTFNNGLNLSSGSTTTFEIDSASAYDALAGNGSDILLSSESEIVFDFGSYGGTGGDTYQVLSGWSDITDNGVSIRTANLGAGLTLDSSQLAVNGTVSLISGAGTPVIAGTEALGNTLKLVVDVQGNGLADLAPLGRDDLLSGAWANIPHSDDGINTFMVTNLTYSTVEGTNVVIYVQTTNPAGFFGIE